MSRRLKIGVWIGAVLLAALTVAIVRLLALPVSPRAEPLPGAEPLADVTSSFEIFWPPQDPEKAHAASARPLLRGTLALQTDAETDQGSIIRLRVTLARPSTEDDREYWNSVLAFADVAWMDQVRVWDQDEQWLWPNLPYLLRLPGLERVQRYGGVDPGKGVDNDFAAVLIRKYDAQGVIESRETQTKPLVSAEWHPVGAASDTEVDLHSVVHAARSDEFQLHVGGADAPDRGQFKVWLIYADFLRANPPPTWPAVREWAGGILAYYEIDWESSPERGCRGIVRQKRPPTDTHFEWSQWVVRTPGADRSQAEARLTDARPARE